jgi:hypothetical protein
MTREQANNKAIDTAKINGRPFVVVPVTYSRGERGFDITPSKDQVDVPLAPEPISPEDRTLTTCYCGRSGGRHHEDCERGARRGVSA